MDTDTPKRPIKTADTIFGIIESIQRQNGATLNEIATDLEMSTSTIHDHLSTLKHKRYIVKINGEYQLGIKFIDHGSYARDKYIISHAAQPIIKNLVEDTSLTVRLWIEEHRAISAVYQERGKHGVEATNWLGKPLSMHSSAPGKAVLAFYDEPVRLKRVREYDLKQYTSNTFTDPDELLATLETVREQKYAFSRGETVEGVRAVSSPVVVDSEPLGAVSIAGARYRLTGDYFTEELPQLLLEAAGEIELEIQDHNPDNYSI